MKNIYSTLQTNFPNLEFKQEHNLATYTTVKIGGPAEVFCETKTSQEFIDLTTYAIKNDFPLTILGLGSNTLISDDGLRGLVIKNSGQNIEILNESSNDDPSINAFNKNSQSNQPSIQPRWHSNTNKGSFKYEFSDLNYDESEYPVVTVKIDSGVSLPFAINHLIDQGITGLQWYSRIPATLGGAIYNNIHGGTHFISEVIESVEIIDEKGNLKKISHQELEARYDFS
ncbi:FAD-binding protein, partial [Patescibacteria group bacterium]|nr:FAD-binding protein [Patescibacteria group bacterium]